MTQMQLPHTPEVEAQLTDIERITQITLRTMDIVARSKEEIKIRKEKVKNTLDNDQVYSELKEEFKELGNRLKQEKLRVIQENRLENQIAATKGMEHELKDQQLDLFSHIDSYKKTTGQDSIEDVDGNVLKLTAQYKITKHG